MTGQHVAMEISAGVLVSAFLATVEKTHALIILKKKRQSHFPHASSSFHLPALPASSFLWQGTPGPSVPCGASQEGGVDKKEK